MYSDEAGTIPTTQEAQRIPALGHTAGDWAVFREPTNTEAGLKQKRCSTCHEILEEADIPALTEATSDGNSWIVPVAVTVAVIVLGAAVTAMLLIRKRKR